MQEERGRLEKGERELILDQLAYLIDEIAALKVVLATFPEAMLEAQPYEGEPSVVSLFGALADREKRVRIPNIEQFIAAADDNPVLATSISSERPSEGPERAISETLDDVSAARTRLLSLLSDCDESMWERAALLGDSEVQLKQYLQVVIEEDLEVLQAAAQRVHESRPVGSPGFTAR